mmetsp:Transcript_20282/g.43749  ORF Transcript_20282/g.43749 Transcript_20282/m.43749 type:complete len:216 (-) Transcript_20282:145-792(-)
MVNRSRVRRVKNVGLTSSRENDINVSLGNLSSRSTIPINTHGTKMDNMSIHLRVNNGTAQVVGSSHVVIDCVSFGFGSFHGIGSGALFGEVYDGVGFFLLDELDEEVVFFGHVEVDEFHFFSGDFLPCLYADIRTLNRSQTITPQLHINIPPTQIIHHHHIMSHITQIQTRGPAAESIGSEDNDLFLLGGAVDANVVGGGAFFYCRETGSEGGWA